MFKVIKERFCFDSLGRFLDDNGIGYGFHALEEISESLAVFEQLLKFSKFGLLPDIGLDVAVEVGLLGDTEIAEGKDFQQNPCKFQKDLLSLHREINLSA